MIIITTITTTLSGFSPIFFLWPCNFLIYFIAICFHFLITHWFLTPCCLACISLPTGAGLSSWLPYAVTCPQQLFPSASLIFECAWSKSYPEPPGWAKWVVPHECLVPVVPQSPSFCCIWLDVSVWPSFAPWNPRPHLTYFGSPISRITNT